MLRRLATVPQVTAVAIGLAAVIAILLSIIVVARTPGPGQIAGGDGSAGSRALARQAAQAQPDFEPSNTYSGVPTPNPTPNGWSVGGNDAALHTVSSGDTLVGIAQLYGVPVESIVQSNSMADPNVLEVGQQLRIPSAADSGVLVGSSFKILPDSELVYGPSAENFDAVAFARQQGGFLASYTGDVEGNRLGGPEIVQLVADRMLVNPRLLLAALEYRSGWVTAGNVQDTPYPLGSVVSGREGLYRQLEWAANQMNRGYYATSEAGVPSFVLADGTTITFAPDINFGTAGIQTWLGAHTGANYGDWQQATGENGFYATYQALFGNPFRFSFEPLLPSDLAQPPLSLPWADDETWFYTGGPHGAWASGSAWAAVDFAPPGDQVGCYQSPNWLLAVADGTVIRSEYGNVVLDLDGDGFVGTGWAIHYLHVDSEGRVDSGTRLRRGQRVGHPGCEGGVSQGTHLHISRSYNGRWISADGPIPFDMAGWVASGFGNEYDGFFVREGVQKEACVCRETINAISAE